MHQPKVSVIIPTYNRKAILKKALDGYTQQTARDKILEILVVDDGSPDGTAEIVSEFTRASQAPVRYLYQENRGQASARNRGIREARGELVLLSDDDVIPTPNSVAEHLAWHQKYPDPKIGVVGSVPYSPEVKPTPFQQWWGLDGVRYRPPCLFPGQGVAFYLMQFCNTSLKREFVYEVGLFDENFRTFGYEDVDFAYRLLKAGGKVLFNPQAVGYHHKRVTFSEACRLYEKSTASRRYFAAKEGGAKLGELEEMWANARRQRIKAFLARSFVPILSPLKPLLDSQIPLPSRLYDVFYLYYGESRREPLKAKGAS